MGNIGSYQREYPCVRPSESSFSAMLITHELDPGEMLAEILKGRRGRSADTERLASLRHDRDLCPRVHNRIKAMLDVYAAYRQDAHDIQGLRDEGVDILLKYRDRDDNEHLAGVQIKSHAEFDEWKAGKNPPPDEAEGPVRCGHPSPRRDGLLHPAVCG